MTKGKVKIESIIPEKDLIESCFNMYFSGYEYKHIIAFHALANHWKANKLIYYINLIEERE